MQEPPSLAAEEISECLRREFGISAQTLDFLPIGNDTAAWVFRATDAGGTSFFVKTRKGAVNPASLLVPRFLAERGISQMVPPLPARSGALWQPLHEFNVIVYPYIDATMAAHAGLTDAQWREFGDALRRIHDMAVSDWLAQQMRRETFVPLRGDDVRRADAYVMKGEYRDDFGRELAAFWLTRRDEILRLLNRADELGRALQAAPRRFAICHADIHVWNVLVSPDGRLYIVDWDEVLLAPVERDLMFQGGALFYEGYGDVTPDPSTIAYYRYEWVVQEIGDYAKRLFFEEFGDETNRYSLEQFKQLFDLGDVVEAAYAADAAE